MMALAIPVLGQAQEMLVLQKPGKVKRVEIKPGTTIQFRLKGSNQVYKKEILRFEDSAMVFANYKVFLDEINMIKIPLNPRLRKYSETIMAAGIILFVADQINNSVIDDNSFSLNRGVSITSTAMIAGGFLIRFLQKRKFKIPGKHKLKLI